MEWSYGDYSQEVADMQQALADAGYDIDVDGYYGPQTESVVSSYQSDNGLTIDGIAGNETLGSLGFGGDSSPVNNSIDSGISGEAQQSSNSWMGDGSWNNNVDWSSIPGGESSGSSSNSQSTGGSGGGSPLNTGPTGYVPSNNYQTLDQIAAQNKYNVQYNPKNNTVTVYNPATKQSVSFMNGQGTQYGMGGLGGIAGDENNMVKDPAALARALQVQNPGIIVTPQMQAQMDSRAAAQEQARLAQEEAARRQAELEAKRAIASAKLDKTLSTENYNALLQKVMDNLMPTYNVSKQETAAQVAEMNRRTDIDAERRGLFNSGVAAELQRKNEESGTLALAKALADLKSSAVNNVNDQVGKQIEAIGMENDWLTKDEQLALENRKENNSNAIDWAKVGLSADELELERQYKNGQLGIDQQNADTNSRKVDNDFFLDQQKIDQAGIQFADEMAYKNRALDIDEQQFAESMGLKWSELGASQKAQLAEATYKAQMLQLQRDEFNLNKQTFEQGKLDAAYKTKITGYGIISDMIKNGASIEEIQSALVTKMPGIDGAALRSLIQEAQEEKSRISRLPKDTIDSIRYKPYPTTKQPYNFFNPDSRFTNFND